MMPDIKAVFSRLFLETVFKPNIGRVQEPMHFPRQGPVASVRRRAFSRRVSPWAPDPDNPGRERALHYTKGWRTRRA